MDFVSFLILFGISVGVFLGLLLISLGQRNKKANRLLGFLLLSFSFSITGFAIEHTHTHAHFPHMHGLPQIALFLFGPLFYLYVRVLTKRKFSFREKHIFHFLPFLFLIIYQIPYIIKSAEQKLSMLYDPAVRLEWLAILAIQIVHLFIYMFFTHKVIVKHEKKIRDTMSAIEKINLRWLKMGMYFFVSVFSLIILFLLLFFAGIDLSKYYQIIVPLSVSFIICIMGYYGLKQPIIFPRDEVKVKAKKYEKSNLNETMSEEYLKKLLAYMETEKPYLQSNLTLHKLASALCITPHHLSQIINDKLNQNFFDFINQYRVKEAQKMLLHPQGQLLTILAISEEVGFNSKTAFNTAFKKLTSMTPTEFRKNGVLSIK
jgi:AraC-like DNA-binding protein